MIRLDAAGNIGRGIKTSMRATSVRVSRRFQVLRWRAGFAASFLFVTVIACCGCRTNAESRDEPDRASVSTKTDRETEPPAPKQAAVSSADAWFTEVTAKTGIDFQHQTGDSPEKPFPAANGSGVACFDLDLDGMSDLYFATGTSFPVDPSRTDPSNRVFRNLGGWQFQDVTRQSYLGFGGYSAGLVVGDIDNDGFSDIYVSGYGGNCFFHNCGDGTFERKEVESGLASDKWGTSGAFLDFDQDGCLDLYVCNYGIWSLETNSWCGNRERNVRFFCSPNTINAEPDLFFQNAANGSFENVSNKFAISETARRGQGVVTVDLNDDGWIDIYVANDLNPNTLLINQQGERFEDITETSGTGYDSKGMAQAGMGVDAADVNRDGLFDLFVTNFEGEYNTLYEGSGQLLFQDVSFAIGLGADSIPWIGWGLSLTDFNLDGWPDAVVSNGHVDNNRHLVGSGGVYEQPPMLWRNKQGRFVLVQQEAGEYFQQRRPGRALLTSDLDNDGDEDLVVGHQDQHPAILMNQMGGRTGVSPSVTLRLIGTVSNRSAIGAQIWMQETTPPCVRQIKGGGSYLSANDLRQVFATADGAAEITFEIRWPNQQNSTIHGLKPGQQYVVIEPRDSSEQAMVLRETN